MTDATLSQVNQLVGLLAREENPRHFIQHLLENYGSVQEIGRGRRGVGNPYAVEKTGKALNYPHGWKPKPLWKQLEILNRYYPQLDKTKVGTTASRLLNASADGLFVTPKITAVAADRIADPLTTNYGVMLEIVLQHLSEEQVFNNGLIGNLGPDKLRIRDTTLAVMQRLEKKTAGDYVVFPAQTGRGYAGYSVRNAIWEIDHNPLQFGMEAWYACHILLTHPERLAKEEDLSIDLSGTVYTPYPIDDREYVLSFAFRDRQQHLTYRDTHGVSYQLGSASGFAREGTSRARG